MISRIVRWRIGSAVAFTTASAFLFTLLSVFGMREIYSGYGPGFVSAKTVQGQVAVVSAASFETTAIAPCSIVAAFGLQLATTTAVATMTPLPKDIAGTKVEVNGVLAELFFVSPMQINFKIPDGTTIGTAIVKVTSGDGTVSMGSIEIREVAPAIFTANSNGQGVPAAVLLRVFPDGRQQYEDIFECGGNPFTCIAKPIDLGPEGERVFLVLFISGTSKANDPNRDGNFNESVHVVLGGTELIPLFAGKHPTLVGLEQINCEIPRGLSGRGRLNLAVAGMGVAASNPAEIEIASPKTSSPPTINDFNPKTVLAGDMLTINSSGHSLNAQDLRVRISGVEAKIVSVSAGQIVVRVPFGACSGKISLWDKASGEGFSAPNIQVRTSISGFVEDTDRQPLSGVSVRLVKTNIVAQTSAEGSFILPDVSPGIADVEVDGTTLPLAQAFPKITIRKVVSSNCDNQFARPISLQQADGVNIVVGGSLASSKTNSVPANPAIDGAVAASANLEIPSNATVRFPEGVTSGVLTVTMVANGRTPVNLPLGVFSSTIVQITPFGVSIEPGAKLTFPNTDNLPAGDTRLFRFDQQPGSATFGSFVDAGSATVTGDMIETQPNAVKETGYYFAARPRETTTIIGHVNDSDGLTPVRLAVVRERGQEGFTDGNGGFILRHVPVNQTGDQIRVETSFARPTGRIDRTQSNNTPPVVKGITTINPDLLLPSETDNRPPAIVAPADLIINAGEVLNFNFIAHDPDAGQTLQVSVSGVSFASVSHIKDECYALKLSPPTDAAGNYTLTITATDNQGKSLSRNISLSVNTASIICGQTIQGNFASVAQKDTYNFSGKAGDEVVITAIGVTGAVCALVELFEPMNNSAPIKRVNCNNTTGKLKLPKDGPYTIVLSESGQNNTGRYDLNLQFADGRCGTMIECGQTVKAMQKSTAQYDIYTFKGKADDPVILTSIGITGAVCAWLDVYTPAGSLLKQVNCNNTTDRIILPSNGIYTVLLHESGFNNTGNYDINLQFADGRCGRMIGCGDTSKKALASVAQYDVHTFDAKANDVVIVTAIGISGAVCIIMDIYSPSGELIKQVNCNNTTGLLKLPENGKYYVVTHESGFNNTGNFDLNLQFLNELCGKIMKYGDTLNADFMSVTQHDVYFFDGKAGETINLTAIGTTGAVCANAAIYESDQMTPLPKNNPCNTSSPNLTLTKDGRYYIVVSEQGFNNTGRYSINLIRIGAFQNLNKR